MITIPASTLPQAVQLIGVHEFGPQVCRCVFCGGSAAGSDGWTLFARLERSDGVVGYVLLFHCRDCDPFDGRTIAVDGVALTVRTKPPSEEWRFVQGRVDPGA